MMESGLRWGDLAEGAAGEFGAEEPPGVTVEVVTTTGRAAAVSFQVGPDTVEVVHWHRTVAEIERGILRAWLGSPDVALMIGELTLSWDRMVDRAGRIAISLSDVREWTLSPLEMANLRDLV